MYINSGSVWRGLETQKAKWLSVRLRTKWFWVRVQFQSLHLSQCSSFINSSNGHSMPVPVEQDKNKVLI